MADHQTPPQLKQLPAEVRNRYEAYQSLRQLIANTKNKLALEDLGAVAMCLSNADSTEPFFDLFIWAGLLADTPDMGDEYTKGVMQCDYLQYLWDKHQARNSQKSPTSTEEKSTTHESAQQSSVKMIASALISLISSASRDSERESAKKLWDDLHAYFETELSDDEYAALRDYCLTIFNQTSFFSSLYTYQRCRELFSDLPEQPNSTWRRRVKNALRRKKWPDQASTQAAETMARALS